MSFRLLCRHPSGCRALEAKAASQDGSGQTGTMMMATTDIETDVPFHESFDNRNGALTDNWGADYSVPGQVTLTGNAGMMEPAEAITSGHGYGTYTVTAKFDGTMPGSAIILWPGDNNWPGQEINLAEVANDGSGRQYATLHWNNNGEDAIRVHFHEGVKGGVFHTYQLVWEPGQLTWLVDGQVTAIDREYVPRDYDHGGMNNVIGVLNNSPDTTLTVTDVDYVPLGGTPPVASPPPAAEPVPAPVAEEPVDWYALAAQVTANFEETGQWFL